MLTLILTAVAGVAVAVIETKFDDEYTEDTCECFERGLGATKWH